MNEEKRKRLARQQALESFDRPVFAKILQAVLHEVLGDRNCLSVALTADRALRALGLPAEWQAGYAIWRVNSEAHALVGHHPIIHPTGGFHAWNVVAGQIVDFTTWRFREAFAEMDAGDGFTTAVEWVPDFLWGERPRRSWNEVVDGHEPGMFYYERAAIVERRLRQDTGAFELAEQLAPLVVRCYRQAAGRPLSELKIDVTAIHHDGIDTITTDDFTLIRPGAAEPAQPRPLTVVDAPTGEAETRAFLEEIAASGVESFTIAVPDPKTGEPVPYATYDITPEVRANLLRRP
jgi:hypothetical protein